ncbi:hypothetical protein MNBD_GAMMA12-658 [hydrothermal vent metagenome]|uniref:Uncharacterized protein n=1 Tax=hydrothermal vent metagenome TaxID=652676 RepID=A0A3B0YNN9_9ZZZZ
MLIEGLFTIELIDNAETSLREIHINFVPEYRSIDVEQQTQKLADYVKELKTRLLTLDKESQEYQGMMTIAQFAENLHPYIAKSEIPLEETIVIEIEQASSLSELISQNPLH